MAALIDSNLPDLKLISKGKVRDIYSTSSPDHLLFVASDRISAYDVILKNGIPDKGKLLTQISLFWFQKLGHIIPNHFVTANIDEMPQEVRKYKDQLDGRAMLVKKAEVVPLEAIVRGYMAGSAWSEYKKSGTVHGIPMPEGIVEGEKLPQPIFTPSTKAEQGAHDENISPEQAAKIVGQELYDQISNAALQLYTTASDYARTRGVILADTKFEFGLIPSPSPSPEGSSTTTTSKKELILIDELLTPDSSRYWPVEGYKPGGSQPSFDKQYLRDWLVSSGFKKGLESGPPGKEGQGWVIDEDIVKGTRERYAEAVQLLTQ
ncbi:SAICAR synthetase [Agrocybe pediades]|nr:SAICAR synthetase [Agrocybe pediades]